MLEIARALNYQKRDIPAEKEWFSLVLAHVYKFCVCAFLKNNWGLFAKRNEGTFTKFELDMDFYGIFNEEFNALHKTNLL